MLTFRSCLLFVLAACGPTAPVSTASAGGEASTDHAGNSTSTTSTTATTSTSTTVTSGPSSGPFVGPPDMGGGTFIEPPDPCDEIGPHGELRCLPVECDPWSQNCPDGQKCSPHSADGDNAWDSLKCVPLDPKPDHPGDPCTAEGKGVSGIDSCDIDSMCWNFDGETMTGTCVLRCKGEPDAPICPPDHACMIANDGVLNLCLPACDPLAQDCPGADLCLPNPSNGDEFLCLFDNSGDGGQTFGACDLVDDCDAGLLCASPILASECDQNAFGCCLPFCDTTAPPSCPGAMQQCLPWSTDDPPPPGLEHLGVCGVPQ